MPHDISGDILTLTLIRDVRDRAFFIAEVAEEGTIARYLFAPLDPIGRSGEYDGRLQVIGPIAD